MGLILFRDYHVYPMYAVIKTYTRRFWKYPRKVGSIHQCKHNFTSFYFGTMVIEEVSQHPLGMMTDQDAYKEGGYSIKGFKNTMEEISKRPWDDNLIPYVVKFRFEISELVDPDGGTKMMDNYKQKWETHLQKVETNSLPKEVCQSRLDLK